VNTRIPASCHCFDLYNQNIFVLWGHERADTGRLLFQKDHMEWKFGLMISIDKNDEAPDAHLLCIGLLYYGQMMPMSVVHAIQDYLADILRDIFSGNMSPHWNTEENGADMVLSVRVDPCNLHTIMSSVDMMIERLR